MKAWIDEHQQRQLAITNALVSFAMRVDLEHLLQDTYIYFIICKNDGVIICVTHHSQAMKCLKLLAGNCKNQRWERTNEYGFLVYKNTYQKTVPITIRLMGDHPTCKWVTRKKLVPAVPAQPAIPEHEEEEQIFVCGEEKDL